MLLILREYFSTIWLFFTDFTIPGVNFSPAIMIFGIFSFFAAIKLIRGILDITTSSFGDAVDRSNAAYRRNHKNG